MIETDNLVVGCGLAGSVMAERLASVLQERVLVIDKRNHIGGNVYDYKTDFGITVHKYGPHIFHTDDKKVWDYLSKFTDWYCYAHRVNVYVEGKEIPLPFNLNSLYHVFPKNFANNLENKLVEIFGMNKKVPILELIQKKEKEFSFLADYIYKRVFLGYTLKQWGVRPEDLDPSVSGRVPVYISNDNRYFQDKYQGIPVNGYTSMIKKMISHPLISLKLNTSWEEIKKNVSYRRLFFTGPIDEFFGCCLGSLPYRSLDIVFKTYEKNYYQSTSVITFPENHNFTRSCEYKYFLDEKSDKTVVSFEYPCKYVYRENEPYYPIPSDETERIYSEYKKLAEAKKDVVFLGRLGKYRYYDMDKVVKDTLKSFEDMLNI